MLPPEFSLGAAAAEPQGLSIAATLTRFSLALILGASLAYRPWRKLLSHAPPLLVEAAHTQLLIAVAGAMMTTVIGDSVSRAFGLVGLGGFIRFRSGIKDPRDAAVMFVMIGVGMACGLGAFSVAICATVFFGGVLMALDMTTQRRTQLVKLSLGLENLAAALPSLKVLHPQARILTIEQAATPGGTAVVELIVPQQMDGLELLEGVRRQLPGVQRASIDPG
ncbi:DUF4956 domain-containing protein [Stigmatella sp. ncwal1]|uniref:DUF4956 domain-containing protein n=1 Tax=Stigmatella ashevillensis TaxID=2995309 RepID=A0ABT5DFQ0_9BACT|nr:DUF4956 domain-containing protein [Stigmatella ashevillena]MDC0712496.1 DUF4956 domain-containing protein [Stigmatella ashevillena]